MNQKIKDRRRVVLLLSSPTADKLAEAMAETRHLNTATVGAMLVHWNCLTKAQRKAMTEKQQRREVEP